jgi:transposase
MDRAQPPKTSETETVALSSAELVAIVRSQAQTIETLTQQLSALTQQLEWFKRQMFGTKSERLRVLQNEKQLALGEVLASPESPAPRKERAIAAHTRRERQSDAAAMGEAESVPFFDESRVPVETIEVAHPDLAGLSADQYEVLGEKLSYRIAQRPGSYVILKYVRPVVKRRDTQAIIAAPAPQGVIEGSRADVSFLAGLLRDKFDYHQPLYRQHRRLTDSGIDVSRPWLTQLGQQSIALLEPIYDAQFDSIRSSRVKTMDETPIKAGRNAHGKMKIAYFWPVYGEHDEICFPFFPSREGENVMRALGNRYAPGSVLLTDGYGCMRVTPSRSDSSTRSVGAIRGASYSRPKPPIPRECERGSRASLRSTPSRKRSGTKRSAARSSDCIASRTASRTWRPSSSGWTRGSITTGSRRPRPLARLSSTSGTASSSCGYSSTTQTYPSTRITWSARCG